MNVHAAAIASSRRAYACMQQSPASSIGHSIGPADRDRLCCLQRSLAGCLCYCVLTLRDHTLPSGPSFEIEPEEIKRGSFERVTRSAATSIFRTDGCPLPLCASMCMGVCVSDCWGERERELRASLETGNGLP